jgi:hypothetical protein
VLFYSSYFRTFGIRRRVTKIGLLGARKAGEPHPFELGRQAVQCYFKVMDECAQAARLKLM